MKKLYIFVIIVLVFISTAGWNVLLEKTEAATLTRQWSFTDTESGLQYNCYEYSDGSFKVIENYYGSIRTITGKAYLNEQGYPKATVDINTSNYQNMVIDNYKNKKIIETALMVKDIVPFFYASPTNYFVYLNLIQDFVVGAISSSIDRSTPDIVKVAFEIACSSQCAIDLANTPGVILPAFSYENQ